MTVSVGVDVIVCVGVGVGQQLTSVSKYEEYTGIDGISLIYNIKLIADLIHTLKTPAELYCT